MDLKDFYLQNIKETEYHYRFLNTIKNENSTYNIFFGIEESQDYQYEIYDVEEAIAKFRELCQPDVGFYGENKCWFYLITYYLHSLGYEIKEFPRILARPPVEPADFTYGEIRNRLIALGRDDNGTVRYATRRAFISELTFQKKAGNIEVDESINQKFVEISTRKASFTNMSTDEKIAEIVNLIENMLKQDGKYITPAYENVCCGFVDDSSVKSYRKKMQCFRHCSDESIRERKTYSERQKMFLIDYGLAIVKAIYELTNSAKDSSLSN